MVRILRVWGIWVYLVYDVGVLIFIILSRCFYGIGGDFFLGLDNIFVRSFVVIGRLFIIYEELYGGVDIFDLLDVVVFFVGFILFFGLYGFEIGGFGFYDLGFIGDGFGLYGFGFYGLGDGFGFYGLGLDGGFGFYGFELDGLGLYDVGLSGFGLSGFGIVGVEIGGLGFLIVGFGVDWLYDESYINGFCGIGFGDFGGLDDGFLILLGFLLIGSFFIYLSINYGFFLIGGRFFVFMFY